MLITSTGADRKARIKAEALDALAAYMADKLPPECRSLAKRKLTQMEALERDAIVRSLEDNANNKLQAATALGMSRATIYRKMRDYGIA